VGSDAVPGNVQAFDTDVHTAWISHKPYLGKHYNGTLSGRARTATEVGEAM
jgi:hypothetical protein